MAIERDRNSKKEGCSPFRQGGKKEIGASPKNGACSTERFEGGEGRHTLPRDSGRGSRASAMSPSVEGR